MTARRGQPGIRLLGVLLIIGSLIPAAGAAYVFAEWLPAQAERYREYRAGAPCPARSKPEQWWEDCRRPLALTVDETEVKGGKSGGYRATVHGPRLQRSDVGFGDPGPLLGTLRPGDKVTGTLWRGGIMALARGDLRQKTADEPRDELEMTAAMGAGLGLVAALAAAFGVTRLAGRGGPGFFSWAGSGKALLVTIASTTFGVGLPTVWIGAPWEIVPPLIVVIVVGVAFLLYRFRSGPLQSQPVDGRAC